MKDLLSFLACICLPFAPAFAQQDSVYMCPCDTTDLTFHGLSFSTFEAPETVNFHTDALLWMTAEDGTATLTGNFIQGGSPENGFTADILFVNRMNWEEWSSQFAPTGYMNDEGVITDEYLDWMFYIMDNSSTLTGFGVYEGSELQLAHAPANNYYAYQVGVGANQQVPLTDGHGGWASVQGTYINSETGMSDQEFQNTVNIYLTYGCEPNTQTVTTLESASLKFKVFPNPATEWISVQMEDESTTGSISYTIFDEQGKAVKDGQFLEAKIDISLLAKGSYVLAVTKGDAAGQLKFIKQ